MNAKPALIGLRAFESAARLLSFGAAAAELGVTASAISHQIALLETTLGVRLFQRTPRAVLLTEEGELLRPYIREAFDKIAQGTSLVASESQRPQTRRLQVYITVAARWLIPRLERCRASFPHLRIRLDTTIMDWDFDPNRADMGLIYAVNPRRDGVEYRPLLRAQLVLVCDKSIGEAIKSRSDLARLAKIEVAQSSLDWDVWSQQNRYDRLDFAQVLQFDSLLLAIEAALNGLGVLVIPEFMIRDDLRAGRLVSPLGRPVPQLGHWYIAYPSARKFDKAVLAFEKWLKDQLHPRSE